LALEAMAARMAAQAQARHRMAAVSNEKAGPAKSMRDQKMRINVMGRMGKLHSLFTAQAASAAPMHDMFCVVRGLGEDANEDADSSRNKEARKLAERLYLASLTGDASDLSTALKPFIEQAQAAVEAAAAVEADAAAAKAEAEGANAKGGKGGKPADKNAASQAESAFTPEIAVELPRLPEWRVVDVRGIEPLALACQRGHTEATKLLLQACADVDAPARACGRTALHRAAEGGHVAVAEALLEAGADVSRRARNGASALHLAAARGHLKLVNLLLSLRETPPADQASEEAATAPGKGKAEPPAEAMDERPQRRRCAVDPADHNGATPLMAAAGAGYGLVVDALLAEAADPNVLDVNGWSALHHACHDGHREIALSLVRAGADPHPTKGDRKLEHLDAHIADEVQIALGEGLATAGAATRMKRPMTAPG